MSIAGYLPPVVAQVLAEFGQYKTGMAEVKAEMTGLQAATTKMAAMGKVAFAALAVGAAAVGFESVKMAMNFDQQMTLIHTQAGAVHEDLGSLSKAILDMAPKVGQGPEKLAEAMYHIESTGMRGAAALDILYNSAKLASIGIADLDTVTYAMSGVMAVGMKDIHSAADAIAFMNATVGMGDMRMEALSRAVGTGVLPSFKSAGLGMIDFSAALATITDNSVPADEAATRLRMTIALMSAPTGKAVEALKAVGIGELDAAHALTSRDKELAKFGITVGQLAADMQQPNGLLVAVKDLKSHLAGLSAPAANQVIEHAFGGGRTSGAILTLLEEVDKLESKYVQLGGAEDRAKGMEAAWAEQQKQFSQQWHEFIATLQVAGVKIGNWLIPKIQSTIAWMREHSEVVKILAIVIGGVLVAAMIAFTASMIAMGVAALANPVVWIIIAIIAAVALLAIGIYELVTHWDTVWGFIKRIALDVWHWLVERWHWVATQFSAGYQAVKTHTIDPLVAAFHFLLERWVTGVRIIKARVIDPLVHFFQHYLLPVVRIVVNIITAIWAFAWGLISTIVTGVIRHVTSGFVQAWSLVKTWFGTIVTLAQVLYEKWEAIWHAIVAVALWVWHHGLSQVFHFIVDNGIRGVQLAIGWLIDAWKTGWDIITTAVKAAWEFIKPIVDAIVTGLDKVGDATGWVKEHAGGAGARLGHLLGFDEGGVVPGPVGAPRLVIAHGGEEILTPEQRAAQGRTGGGRSTMAASGGGDVVINATFKAPNGQVMWNEQLRYARRAGLTPDQLYPATAKAI